MADVAEATTPPLEEPKYIVFRGMSRNLVPGMAMVLASLMAFAMGMTDVFFAEATAWILLIWGLLLIYMGLLDFYESFVVTDEALVIQNSMRPWGRRKDWDWAHINRVDVKVRKKDRRMENALLQVYHTAEGELAVEREDHAFDPELARLVIGRAGLSPTGKDNPQDLHQLPLEQKVTYTWR